MRYPLSRTQKQANTLKLGCSPFVIRFGPQMWIMTNPFRMKNVLCYSAILLAVLKESLQGECWTVGSRNLTCKFSSDLTLNRKEFSVFFHPENGSEAPGSLKVLYVNTHSSSQGATSLTESLAHCMWADGIYDCIEQEGVKCYQPVSDFAVISLPTRFVNKAGSYKCKADGDGIDSIIPCFPEKQGNKQVDSSNAKTVIEEGHQMIVSCSLPTEVESFRVELDKKVVFNFSKEYCRSSNSCHHQTRESQHVITVQLNISDEPYSQCTCIPDEAKFETEVTGCIVSSDTHSEMSQIPVFAVIISAMILLLLCGAAVFLLLRSAKQGCSNQERGTETSNKLQKPFIAVSSPKLP